MLIGLVWSTSIFCGEIHDAAEAGDLVRIQTLIKDNPNLISSKDEYAYTPLHSAALFGSKDVAELLIINRVEVNARNNDGFTPLHIAAAEKRKDVVELLRQHGGHE